jgi:hypothetical protein
MAANRKNKPAAVRFGPVIYVLLFCLFLGGSGIGYVWQKNQINALGMQIKQAETRLDELRRLNKQRSDTLAFMRSPQVLDARVKELNLGLAAGGNAGGGQPAVEPGDPADGCANEERRKRAMNFLMRPGKQTYRRRSISQRYIYNGQIVSVSSADRTGIPAGGGVLRAGLPAGGPAGAAA